MSGSSFNMDQKKVRETIIRVGVVPVVRAPSATHALMATEAVCKGGIPVVEITMTVPGAVDAIRQVVASIGSDVLVGAGTVLDRDTAKRCLEAGAQFLVTPGLDPATVEYAKAQAVTIIPGVLTPSELMAALKLGSNLVKIFPCGEVGGPRYIKALRGPFPNVEMIPTGGVNEKTAADFLRAGAVALGVGGELVSAKALADRAPEVITATARRFVEIVQSVRKEQATAP